jgi:hypothetical protein
MVPPPLACPAGSEGDAQRGWLAWAASGVSSFLTAGASQSAKSGTGLPDAPTEADMQVAAGQLPLAAPRRPGHARQAAPASAPAALPHGGPL